MTQSQVNLISNSKIIGEKMTKTEKIVDVEKFVGDLNCY